MPNERGELTDDEMDRAKKWIADKAGFGGKVPSCPICKGNWGIANKLAHVSAGHPLTTASFPCVVTLCNNCGYSQLFNAIKMGVVSPASNDDKEAGDE